MWLIENRTGYAADRIWKQDQAGNKVWLVVVKATFDVVGDGRLCLADEQVPVWLEAQHRAEPGRSSLAQESDLFGLKVGTDVLLDGSAWALPGRRSEAVDVGLSVGVVKKSLRVFGNRSWRRGIVDLMPSAPEPFESMPISYENAYGGADRLGPDTSEHRIELRNPVGKGFALRPAGAMMTALPNIEDPRGLIRSWSDRPVPSGFGPVDCAWSPRRELAGTYDENWRQTRFPLWAEDFDARYHQAAPADQQAGEFLRGGEAVELTNLSRGGRLAFALPRIHLAMQSRFGRTRKEHRTQLCTVSLEPDRSRLTLAWQSSLVCNRGSDDLDVTVISEKRLLQ